MARETRAQRVERERDEAQDLVRRLTANLERLGAENARLTDRCSFLYERAMSFATDHARRVLEGPTEGDRSRAAFENAKTPEVRR